MYQKIKYLVFIIACLTGCSNPENSWSEKDFVFTVELSPAFHPTSQIILESTGKSQKLHFRKLYDQNMESSDTLGYVSENVSSLVQCQMNDCFSHDVLVKMIEQKNLTQSDFDHFKNQLQSIELSTQQNLIKREVCDGMSIFLRFKNQTHVNVFGMKCPRPSDSTEYLIITSVLELANKTFENEDSKEYFKEMQKYF